MGGGIAYASALAAVAIRMKDIAQGQLDRGLEEVDRLLAKQVSAGRLTAEASQAVRARITPQLDYSGFGDVELVIEAVVENLAVKHRVLTELEKLVAPDTIVATNTSSLRVDDLAAPLARPGNFVGLHFFNPVPVMPLVEVIQGSKTSAATVATAVGYALSLGKTPIVVKDCPGFLVNRLLTAYLLGFAQLIFDGADFVKVDRAMEAFGWPMGPAYLADVIGLDTMSHIIEVICAGYPQRMTATPLEPTKVLAGQKRYGQKSGVGFYRYEADATGRRRKALQPDTHQLLAPSQAGGTARVHRCRDRRADDAADGAGSGSRARRRHRRVGGGAGHGDVARPGFPEARRRSAEVRGSARARQRRAAAHGCSELALYHP